MGNIWQLQDAKNKFSNLVESAQHDGPQFVTKHGKESVVVLSAEEYRKIIRPKSNLFNFLQNSPMAGQALELTRDKSLSRDVEL